MAAACHLLYKLISIQTRGYVAILEVSLHKTCEASCDLSGCSEMLLCLYKRKRAFYNATVEVCSDGRRLSVLVTDLKCRPWGRGAGGHDQINEVDINRKLVEAGRSYLKMELKLPQYKDCRTVPEAIRYKSVGTWHR